jgi:hypothetical protein
LLPGRQLRRLLPRSEGRPGADLRQRQRQRRRRRSEHLRHPQVHGARSGAARVPAEQPYRPLLDGGALLLHPVRAGTRSTGAAKPRSGSSTPRRS